jgi:cytochrome P450
MNILEKNISEINTDFDPLMDSSPAFLQDPYPTLHRMRARGHLVWSERGNQWLVTSMEEANLILKSKSFGKALERWKHPSLVMRFVQRFSGRFGLQNILRQDPPEHTRVRGLISSAFVPSVVRDLEPQIAETAEALIDGFATTSSADLISQFAFPLPITVIADLLGVSKDDREQFRNWSTTITGSMQGNACPYKVMKSLNASFELRKYLRQTVAKKLKRPDESLLSRLAQVSSSDRDKLSEEELISNSVLLLIAGHETTVNLIGNGMYYLLRNYQDWRMLLENPQLVDAAIEEILRFDSPVQIVRRIANENLRIGKQSIRKDDVVTILIGACNRDGAFFYEPDRFDLFRENKKHISFGAGIHYCLGAELARTEARIAIRALMRRLPDMKIGNQQCIYKGPFALRGLQSLIFDPGWKTA